MKSGDSVKLSRFDTLLDLYYTDGNAYQSVAAVQNDPLFVWHGGKMNESRQQDNFG